MQVTVTGNSPIGLSATIANGASLSGAIDLSTQTLLGYVMPAAWTTAGLTFQVSLDGVTYVDLYDNAGTEISHVVGASRFVRVSPADWVGIKYVKVRSGTAAAPVNQGASRAITLVTKAV